MTGYKEDLTSTKCHLAPEANLAGGRLSHCRLKMALALDYTATSTTSYHVSYHGHSFDTCSLQNATRF